MASRMRETFAPARAPRLRRMALILDARAERSAAPARARALACQMRLRASELEAGIELSDEQESTRLLSLMSGERA